MNIKNKIDRFFIFLLITTFPFLSLMSQTTRLRGVITDGETKEPLPFVGVVFKGTTVGTVTDFNGKYFLESRIPRDTILVSCVGYKTIILKIQRNAFQTLNFELEKESVTLQEVVIFPGENPAHILLQKIYDHKEQNNPDKVTSYQYELYNKLEFDVNNITEEYKQKKVFKQFQFIFDYIDTSAITGKTYLPIFISETLSDFYFSKNPPQQQEIIKANNISGVENESVTQFTGDLYVKLNIYDNFINLFQKGFISPIANIGKLYYKYYLIDSMFIDNQWCYQISFKPRRKQEPTFTGDFWVHDTTFAIKKIQVRIAEDANLNFIQDMVISHEYTLVEKKYWFLKKEEVFADINLAEKNMGFFGRKTTIYKNIVIDPPGIEKYFNKSYDITVLENATKKDNIFWDTARFEKLTDREQSIYGMVDSIKRVPMFKTVYDFIVMFTTYYYVMGKYEFGPYYKTYSFNPIEGNRFRLGGRTSNEFSTKIMPDGFIAYGTKDQKFKYGGGFIYIFSTLPRRATGVHVKHDYEQLGQSPNAFFHDNILSSLLRRNPNNKLSMVNEYKSYYEREWFQGFSNTLTLIYKEFMPTEYILLERFNEAKNSYERINRLSTSEILINTRFAYKEDYVLGKFERISLGSYYPIINMYLTIGLNGVLKSQYEYYKLHININDHFNINPFGEFEFILDAAKIWGMAPYPLLQLHEGNETYAFDKNAFNMMNYYEFVSDQYVSLHAEHHFDGFFLNRIPLFRKLKWREVVSGTGLIGSLSTENETVMKFPLGLSELNNGPYFESSIGVENILKFIRVDAVYRLSYLDKPDISKFGFRVNLQINF